MTATVTNLTAAAVTSDISGAFFFTTGIILIILLLALLGVKELMRASGASQRWSNELNIVIVPLLLAFGFVVAVRLLNLLS